MQIWIDSQISPAIAPWMRKALGVDAVAVRDLGLRQAEDPEIFWRARADNAAVLTKDSDFLALLQLYGPPPQVVWLRSGNTSNVVLRAILSAAWPAVAAALGTGEPLIELREAPG